MDANPIYQPQGEPRPQGLHVTPLPPKKAGRGWRIFRWVLLSFVTVACVGAVIVYAVFSGGIATSAGRGDRIIEKHVSGPSGLTAAAKIAVVTVDDIIVGTEDSGYVSWILRQLGKAAGDSKVKAVLLDVDSPGGGITASDIVHQRVLELQEQKPVVVLMRDIAASGAYYISAPAEEIFAHPTTITGSIGVIISSYNIEGLFNKIGVQSVVFKSGPYKDLLSPYRPVSEEERVMLQGITDEMFERFKHVVAEGRQLTPEEVEAVSTGAIFTAREAVERKLVDSIGYYEDALKAVIEYAEADESTAEVVRYVQPPTLVDVLFGAKSEAGGMEAAISDFVATRKPGFYYLWPGP